MRAGLGRRGGAGGALRTSGDAHGHVGVHVAHDPHTLHTSASSVRQVALQPLPCRAPDGPLGLHTPPHPLGDDGPSDDVMALSKAFCSPDEWAAPSSTAAAPPPVVFEDSTSDAAGGRPAAPAVVALHPTEGNVTVAEDPLASLHAGDAAAAAAARDALLQAVASRGLEAAPVVLVEGRRFDVETIYAAEPVEDYVQAAVACIMRVHSGTRGGDVLVFLTGQEDIEGVADGLKKAMEAPAVDALQLGRAGGLTSLPSGVVGAAGAVGGAAAAGAGAMPSTGASASHAVDGKDTQPSQLLVLPIYGALSSEQQSRVFDKTPQGKRKVVLATNIAETSLTIDGIVFVIDCGLQKVLNLDPATGVRALTPTLISRANASQRMGRAGRTAPGVCYRLYTRWTYANEMSSMPTPELLRADVVSVALSLYALGVTRPERLELIDALPDGAVARASAELRSLGLLEHTSRQLSLLGAAVASLPLEPPLACTLIAAASLGVKATSLALSLCAVMSSGSSLFVTPTGQHSLALRAHASFFSGGGDHVTMVRAFEAWVGAGAVPSFARQHFLHLQTLQRAASIRQQLLRQLPSALSTVRQQQVPPGPLIAACELSLDKSSFDADPTGGSTSYVASADVLRHAMRSVEANTGADGHDVPSAGTHVGATDATSLDPSRAQADLDGSRVCARGPSVVPPEELIGRALAAGYLYHIARYAPAAEAARVDVNDALRQRGQGGTATGAAATAGGGDDGRKGLLVYSVQPGGSLVGVAAGSHLFRCDPTPELVVFHELIANRRGRVVMRTVTAIDRAWVPRTSGLHSNSSLKAKRRPPAPVALAPKRKVGW